VIFQDEGVQAATSETLLERVLRILNYPFIHQRDFQVSVLSLCLFVLVLIAAVVISKIVRRLLEKRVLDRLDAGLRYTLLRVLHYVIMVAGFLYALKLGFSLDLTSVAVLLSFLSVGIGFGLQYVAADVLAGFILLFERPVHVGDRIKLDDGVEGKVERISIRATVIITNENMAVILPNSKLTQNRFINYSHGERSVRLNIPVGVAYGSDLEIVSKALIEAANAVPEVLKSPAPRPHFQGFGDSALDFQIRVWINTPHKHPQIRSKINFEIERAFRTYNLEIPFPQRDVRIRESKLIVESPQNDGSPNDQTDSPSKHGAYSDAASKQP